MRGASPIHHIVRLIMYRLCGVWIGPYHEQNNGFGGSNPSSPFSVAPLAMYVLLVRDDDSFNKESVRHFIRSICSQFNQRWRKNTNAGDRTPDL